MRSTIVWHNYPFQRKLFKDIRVSLSMISALPLLFLEVIILAVYGYYDLKSFSIPKKFVISTMALIALAYIVWFFLDWYFSLILAIIGVIMYLVLRPVFHTQAKLDKVIYLVSFITLPFVALFAIALQQAVLIVIAVFKREKVLLPMMALYAPCFLGAALIMAATIGIGNPYL